MTIETLQATKKLLITEVGNLVIYKNELYKISCGYVLHGGGKRSKFCTIVRRDH